MVSWGSIGLLSVGGGGGAFFRARGGPEFGIKGAWEAFGLKDFRASGFGLLGGCGDLVFQPTRSRSLRFFV